jgi:hypothetical protein
MPAKAGKEPIGKTVTTAINWEKSFIVNSSVGKVLA